MKTNLVNKSTYEKDNGDFLITEECKELRRQVQLAKEEKHIKLFNIAMRCCKK